MEVAAFFRERSVIVHKNGNYWPEVIYLIYVSWVALAILLLLEIKIMWYFPIIILTLNDSFKVVFTIVFKHASLSWHRNVLNSQPWIYEIGYYKKKKKSKLRT